MDAERQTRLREMVKSSCNYLSDDRDAQFDGHLAAAEAHCLGYANREWGEDAATDAVLEGAVTGYASFLFQNSTGVLPSGMTSVLWLFDSMLSGITKFDE